MIAPAQFTLSPSDLQTILAVVRTRTLTEAAKRLGNDTSTVFRSIQRIEKGLGQVLFDRSRHGSHPSDLALQLAQHAERIELELDVARAVARSDNDRSVSGLVRVTTTDTVLHGILFPILADLSETYPSIQLALSASNEFASLAKHDADIALRVTLRPPDYLIGKHVARMRMAIFGPKSRVAHSGAPLDYSLLNWIAPDDHLPNHASVTWRKRTYPTVIPKYNVDSILSVVSAIGSGLGVGLIPTYLARGREDLVQLSDPIDECDTQLWSLIRAESRHIVRVSTVYKYLSKRISDSAIDFL